MRTLLGTVVLLSAACSAGGEAWRGHRVLWKPIRASYDNRLLPVRTQDRYARPPRPGHDRISVSVDRVFLRDLPGFERRLAPLRVQFGGLGRPLGTVMGVQISRGSAAVLDYATPVTLEPFTLPHGSLRIRLMVQGVPEGVDTQEEIRKRMRAAGSALRRIDPSSGTRSAAQTLFDSVWADKLYPMYTHDLHFCSCRCPGQPIPAPGRYVFLLGRRQPPRHRTLELRDNRLLEGEANKQPLTSRPYVIVTIRSAAP